MSFRAEVVKQVGRAEFRSGLEQLTTHVYAIREKGVPLRASIIGASVSTALVDIIRQRGGHCRRICTFVRGRKTV